MARSLRIDFPGAVHHIYFRGNRKEDIFIDDRDRLKFLEFLMKAKDKNDNIIYAYCLMNNHVHLLIESGNTHIGKFMQELLTNYVQFFNWRWSRVGHLLQGRYKNILVDMDRYLMALLKYIHLNPVRAGFCALPEDYIWSSHLEYLGLKEAIIDMTIFSDKFKTILDYKNFINETTDINIIEKRYEGYKFYGDEIFMNKTLDKVGIQKRKLEGVGKKIKIKDIEKFIKYKFGKHIRDIKLYYDNEMKCYAVVLLRKRVNLTLMEIGKITGFNFRTIHDIYHKTNADIILQQFDEFRK
ncbi:transposase [candidate division WOR-3 bacterium]|nr:transposase [candidate division WOR-3 bacterium]